MSINRTCPACEIGNLVLNVKNKELSYKDKLFVINDFKYSVCNHCGENILTPQDRKYNNPKIRDKQREIDGLLTSNEILNILNKIGITKTQASMLLGGGPNSFSKYIRGEVIQSVPMDKLIRLLDLVPQNLPMLEKTAKKLVIETNKILDNYSSSYEYNISSSETMKKESVKLKGKQNISVLVSEWQCEYKEAC